MFLGLDLSELSKVYLLPKSEGICRRWYYFKVIGRTTIVPRPGIFVLQVHTVVKALYFDRKKMTPWTLFNVRLKISSVFLTDNAL